MIAALQDHNNLRFVVLLGGEPGLFPGLTHELAGMVQRRELGVRVESSASWAVDRGAARAFLEPLCAVGTQRGSVSRAIH